MTYSIPDMLHMTACFALIISGVICGTIRWFHMCHPYNQQADYFYPARKGAMVVYSGTILLLPYFLQINDQDSWIFASSFGILYYPSVFAWLVQRYFGKPLYYKSFRFLLFEMPTLIMFSLLFLGCTSLFDIHGFSWVRYVVGIWGIVLIIHLMATLNWLKTQIINYHYERYSNAEDFPYRFAERCLYSPLLIVALMWLIFITNSRDVKMLVDWLMTIYYVVFLCVILHPQRGLMADERNHILERIESEEYQHIQESFDVKAFKDTENDDEQYIQTELVQEYAVDDESNTQQAFTNKKIKLNDEQLKYYQEIVIQELRDKQAFLDCHYNLAKLSQSIHVGRTYTSQVCSSLGGFYNLVNRYRVEYAEQYQREHPNATQDKVSIESGFKDRKAYHRAKSLKNT